MTSFISPILWIPAHFCESQKRKITQTGIWANEWQFPVSVCLPSLSFSGSLAALSRSSFHSSPESSAIGRDVHSQKATEVPGRVALYARLSGFSGGPAHFQRPMQYSTHKALADECVCLCVAFCLWLHGTIRMHFEFVPFVAAGGSHPRLCNSNNTRALQKSCCKVCAHADIKGLDTNKTLCRSQYLRHFYTLHRRHRR